MHVFDKIIQLFDQAQVEYEIIEHPPVHTSEQAAQIRDTDISNGAKALVFYADKNPVLLVVPGDKRVNLNKFKKTFNVKDLRFATPDQVKDLTNVEVGAVPPVGKSIGLQSYYDTSFQNKRYVTFNAGYHTKSIKMNPLDLLKVEDPVISDIT